MVNTLAVKHGTGNLHTLVYGDDIKKALKDVSQTTASIKGAVGNVEKIVDDLEKKQVTDNIKNTLANVEKITEMIKNG